MIAARWLGAKLHRLDVCDSTNDEAAALASAAAPHGTVVIAREQRGGRGRGAHLWHSPPEDNLYVSCILRPDLRVADVAPTTLAVGRRWYRPSSHFRTSVVLVSYARRMLGFAVVGLSMVVLGLLWAVLGGGSDQKRVRRNALTTQTETARKHITSTLQTWETGDDADARSPTVGSPAIRSPEPKMHSSDMHSVVEPNGTGVYARDDGTVVRDQRYVDGEKPISRTVMVSTTLRIRNDVRQHVQKCAQLMRNVSENVHRPFQVDLTLGIHGGIAHVDAVAVQIPGVSEQDVVDSYTGCVQSRLLGKNVVVSTEQKDVDTHLLSMSFQAP